MDPNLFHLDWARVAEVLVAIMVLALLIERALAVLFESKFFLHNVQGKRLDTRSGSGETQPATPDIATETSPGRGREHQGVGTFPIKELIAFVVAAVVCVVWKFDAISMIFLKEQTTVLGAVVTGGIVAGGSKASVKLFRDVMGIKSTARKLLDESRQ